MDPTRSIEERSGTERLLEQLIASDPAAWATLLERTEQRLRVLLHFRLDPATRLLVEPEDILQQTFADALTGIDHFEYRGPGSLQRWLSQILINRIHTERSRSQRAPRPESSLNQPLPKDSDSHSRRALLQWISSRSGPSSEAKHRERVDRIRRVVEELPDAERDVVLLVVYQGLSNAEAATMLAVDPSTVSVRLKRALARCSSRLKEFGT